MPGMISNRERNYLKRVALEFARSFSGANVTDHWLLKDRKEDLIPESTDTVDGYIGEYLSLVHDTSAGFDLELWTESYASKYQRRNALWFGLHSPRRGPMEELIGKLRGGPFEPIEWIGDQIVPEPRRLVYDNLGRGQYYLGLYEEKRGALHEAVQVYLERCTRFIDAICLLLPQESETSEANAEVVRQKRVGDIASRRGQKQFSRMIRRNYGRRCAVTNCSTGAALESAHIRVAANRDFNNSTNRILLRADIHALFDSYLITFTEEAAGLRLTLN
jgi:HNH endonuclease